jgi:hypothetical protein
VEGFARQPFSADELTPLQDSPFRPWLRPSNSPRQPFLTDYPGKLLLIVFPIDSGRLTAEYSMTHEVVTSYATACIAESEAAVVPELSCRGLRTPIDK